MLARLMAFGVWTLLAAGAVYWSIQLLAQPLPTPLDAVPAGEQSGARADLSRLLGRTPAAPVVEVVPVADGRLRLLGLVAPRDAASAEAGEGVALIEVDGVARTVRVGAVVDGELRLLKVGRRSAALGPAGGPISQTLEVAALPAPVTGVLTPAAPSPVVLGGMPNLSAPDPDGEGSQGPSRNPRGSEGLPLRR